MTAAADLDTDFELVHVHPEDLIIGPNVRRDPQYADLVASVREVGVLSPISAFWNSEGSLVVVLGQRRTLAAREAVRDTVPVYVIPEPDDVSRLVDQYVENAHRADLTTADVVETWRQLEALGVDVDAIAQRTTTPVDRVNAGLQVARTPAAVGTIRKYPQATLDQAIAFAEFADDKDATGRLVHCLEEGRGFDHAAQQLRDDRAENEAKDALERELAGVGVKLWDSLPYGTDGKAAQLTELKDGKRNCTPANHAACPGHAAYVRRRWASQAITFEAVYLCRDWRKHEHTPRHGTAGARSSGSSESTPEETAERKRVIAGNKAWRAATEVRRRWLTDFVQRKNVSEHDVERFIADVLVASEHVLSNALGAHHSFYFRLVAGETPEQLAKAEQVMLVEVGSPRAVRRERLADEINTATRPHALAITAGLILAAWERHAADPMTWRDPTGGNTYHQCRHGRYLAAMAAWGYELAPIEQALVDGTPWQPDTTA